MYRYAVFISYKRHGDYQKWIDDVFYPIVQNYFIGRYGKSHAFKDTQEQAEHYGESLDNFINSGLVYSKCMVAVLNGPYFCNSFWCPKEFSIMKFRADKLQKPLLLPVIFTKRDSNASVSLLKDACPGLAADIEKCYLPLFLEENKYLYTNNAFINSPDYNELVKEVRKWLDGSVVPAIKNAPAWQEDWNTKDWLEGAYKIFKEKIDCTDINKQSLL
jgi:hypothetical protein